MPTKKVTDFDLPTNGGGRFKLSDHAGKNVVLYFYPKDSTPGCTTEGIDFAALHDSFIKANTVVVGVSRDSVKSHDNFCAKHGGIERSTFIIGPERALVHEWRGVKVAGHAQAVLDFVTTLS